MAVVREARRRSSPDAVAGGHLVGARDAAGMDDDRPAGRRALLADGAILVVVAGVLVGVHLIVPAGVRGAMALDYARPDPLHAFTAAYVHLGDAHLRGNVVGVLLAGGFAALLAALVDEHRWFRLSTLAYLTVLPVLVGMTEATIVGGSVVGRGFSSVLAGFVGFVLVSPGVVVRRGFGFAPWVGWNAVAGLSVVSGGVILWATGVAFDATIVGVLGLGLLLVLATFARPALDRSAWPDDRETWRRLAGAATTVALVAAVVAAFAVGLFPADIARGDGVTNILGHFLGLVYGAVIATWGSRYWTAPGSAEPRELSGADGVGRDEGA